MSKKKKQTLEECLQNTETYDEFCEKCGKLINEQTDMTAQELWEEYWSRYNEQ